MKHPLDLILPRIRHYASKNGLLAEKHLAHWLSQLPADDPQAQAALKQGRQVKGVIGDLKGLIRREGQSPVVIDAVSQARRRVWSTDPKAQRHLNTLLDQGLKEARPWLLSYSPPRAAWRDSGSSVHPTQAPHRIDLLPCADRWTLLIDESGANFKPGTTNPRDPQPEGRFVGLLLNDEVAAQLPTLSRFHGTDETDARIDEALQEILNHPVGVMGITVNDVPATPSAYWQVGVLELIDWVIKLLPREPDRETALEILVEQRSAHRAGDDWRHAVSEIQRRLAKISGEEPKIQIEIKIIGKDDHRHLAYADALAYSWGSTRVNSATRLKQTQLLNTCLIERGAQRLSSAWDKVQRGEPLSAKVFLDVAYEGSSQPESLSAALLAQLGDALSADEDLWRRYLQLADAHLEGKSIHLPALSAQFDLLRASNPSADLSPRTLLAWEAGRIARDNHLGEIDPLSGEIVEALSAQLFDEDAPLACLSDLQRAVAACNAFDFARAEQLIRPWLEHPIAVPGLQMHGRVLSSLGQIHAFRDEQPQARARFEQALAAFERLSDPTMRQGEKIQTGTYRIISFIDDEDLSDAEVRAALTGFFKIPKLDDAIRRFACADQPWTKYAHHALLRFLIQRGSPAEKQLYLEHMDPDAVEYGHPWPLILLYRALLLREAGRPAEATLDAAIDQTLDKLQGPTLTMIGATLMAVAARWGHARHQATLQDILSFLSELLPHATERVERVAKAAEFKSDLAFIRAALPFNFR